METAFLPEDEQKLFDGVVHSLRSRGWSRMDAEDVALERVEQRRAVLKQKAA